MTQVNSFRIKLKLAVNSCFNAKFLPLAGSSKQQIKLLLFFHVTFSYGNPILRRNPTGFTINFAAEKWFCLLALPVNIAVVLDSNSMVLGCVFIAWVQKKFWATRKAPSLLRNCCVANTRELALAFPQAAFVQSLTWHSRWERSFFCCCWGNR